MALSVRDGLVVRALADGEAPGYQDWNQGVDRVTAAGDMLADLLCGPGGEGLVAGVAANLAAITDGTDYPALTGVVRDDAGHAWWCRSGAVTVITFNVTSTAAGDARLYLVPGRFTGDDTAGDGGLADFAIVADDVANGAPEHSLLLGSGTITASALTGTYTPAAAAAPGILRFVKKADTGHTAGVLAGTIELNPTDGTISMYDGAAWRDLATWTP